MFHEAKLLRFAALLAASLTIGLAGCGGGGDDGGGDTGGGGDPEIDWTPGVFMAAATFEAQCAAPRTGTDPTTGQPFADIQGSRLSENHWLRSWSNNLYLWYDEITDQDPDLFATPDYFEVLKSEEITPSGNPKDKFHFTFATDEWVALSQSGVTAGYGATWAIIQATTPRRVVVAFTEPNSPATAPAANLARGAEVLMVDGVDVVNDATQAAVDTLNAAFFPAEVGESHVFEVMDLGSTVARTVTLESAVITTTPVQNVSVIDTLSGPVGYMLFNDHIATAEEGLVNAVATLDAANITDLVLDMRYNGGGFLDIAGQLAYMIAGPVPASGQTFEEIRFNDKHPATNPITGQALGPRLFPEITLGFSLASGQPLPTLDLPRVFVLTGPSTCSASESIMNSLEGVDVEVIQIGTTTCGKPYGFFPQDNCGTTYFTIQFQGVNAKGFGDYTDGFSPANTVGTVGTVITGCSVPDDFTHALGDAEEARVAAALAYRDTQTCPPVVSAAQSASAKTSRGLHAVDGFVRKSPWHENRIMQR